MRYSISGLCGIKLTEWAARYNNEKSLNKYKILLLTIIIDKHLGSGLKGAKKPNWIHEGVRHTSKFKSWFWKF